MLHSIGEEGLEIFKSFNLDESDARNMTVVIKHFDEHFIQKTNVTFERHLFFNKKQGGDPYEQYMATLKNISLTCNFGDLRESLVDIFISGINDAGLK